MGLDAAILFWGIVLIDEFQPKNYCRFPNIPKGACHDVGQMKCWEQFVIIWHISHER